MATKEHEVWLSVGEHDMPCPLIGGEVMEPNRRRILATALRESYPGIEDLRCPRSIAVNGKTLDLWIAEARVDHAEVVRQLIVVPREHLNASAKLTLYDDRIAAEGQRGTAYLDKDGTAAVLLRCIDGAVGAHLASFVVRPDGTIKHTADLDLTARYEGAPVDVIPSRSSQGLRFRLAVYDPGRVSDSVVKACPQLIKWERDGQPLYVRQLEVYAVRATGLEKVASVPPAAGQP